jgi:hypothetical protein
MTIAIFRLSPGISPAHEHEAEATGHAAATGQAARHPRARPLRQEVLREPAGEELDEGAGCPRQCGDPAGLCCV